MLPVPGAGMILIQNLVLLYCDRSMAVLTSTQGKSGQQSQAQENAYKYPSVSFSGILAPY